MVMELDMQCWVLSRRICSHIMWSSLLAIRTSRAGEVSSCCCSAIYARNCPPELVNRSLNSTPRFGSKLTSDTTNQSRIPGVLAFHMQELRTHIRLIS
jgi:hypothetical protein